MIKLNINEGKKIKFNVNVSGFEIRDLKGSMKLTVEGVEYGFPIKIDNGSVSVEVPPLSSIMKKTFNENEHIDARLDVIAGDTYINPWKDTIIIENPVHVEVKVSEVENVVEEIKPTINIEKIEEEVKKVEKIKEDCGKDHKKKKKEDEVEEECDKKKKKKSKFMEALEK